MKKQLLPISISLGLFIIFSLISYILLKGLDGMHIFHESLSTNFIWVQIGLGIFIYLKTAVDYALFVGMLIEKNEGLNKRIAMNVGTSLGCFVGVTAIVILWSFFREIHWLMFILLILAACVLFGLGDGSQEHFEEVDYRLRKPLEIFFKITRPVVEFLTFFMPDSEMKAKTFDTKKLFIISAIIPFALGADDLAGYMTLLTPMNVLSLLIGIYFGDAIIDIALFWNRDFTVKIVKNKWVSYFGALFFVGLGIMSIYHAISLYI